MKLDQEVLSIEGSKSVKLDELLGENKTFVVLVRHLGWPYYQEFLAQLRESFEKFERSDVIVVVVAPANRDQIQEFMNVHGPFPFDIYGDPELELYEEMGNHHMSAVKSMLSVGVDLIKGEVKISDIVPKDKKERKHFLSAVKNQDVNIQGSSWLFDRNGEVLWKHVDDTPEDHARVDEVLKQLRK